MSMPKVCSGSEVHMAKWIPFYSTHQMLPSNQTSANKQIHTHKKYQNKLALVHGVKCCTGRWTWQCGKMDQGRIRASKGSSHGSGDLSIHMGGKDLQRRIWCSSCGQKSHLDEDSEECSIHAKGMRTWHGNQHENHDGSSWWLGSKL